MEGDDAVMLGAFPVEDYMRIHVVDASPSSVRNQYTDVSLVDKYEMPEEEYAKRSDSVLAFKQRNRLGRFGKNDESAHLPIAEDTFEKEASAIKVGERCEIDLGSGLKRRGTVKFVGTTKFKPGFWVGIHYDEPFGKNDGSVEGERYFTCPPKHGSFVRPNKVVTGDFPEEDFDDDELEEM
jgi:tubulin-folding cofactor B